MPGARPAISFDPAALAEVCRRHGVRRLSLFGSVLRHDFGPESDVDVLVEFVDPLAVGLRFFALEEDLASVFGGRRIDLLTPGFLSESIRERVVAGASLAWAA